MLLDAFSLHTPKLLERTHLWKPERFRVWWRFDRSPVVRDGGLRHRRAGYQGNMTIASDRATHCDRRTTASGPAAGQRFFSRSANVPNLAGAFDLEAWATSSALPSLDDAIDSPIRWRS